MPLHTVDEVLQHHPIRNRMWTYDPKSGIFSTFASDLKSLSPWENDPWGRPLQNARRYDAVHDNEGDITHWEGTTSLRGVPIKITVWND